VAHLIVTSTEDEVGVGVLVKDLLDDFSLVDGERSNLEVLLSDEYFDRTPRSESAL